MYRPLSFIFVIVIVVVVVIVQMNKSVTNIQELGALGNGLTRDYGVMAEACSCALSAGIPSQVCAGFKLYI